MRAEARALAINSRSIEAMRRLSRVAEGAYPIEAVLDIVVPFPKRSDWLLHRLGIIYVYQMPATTDLFA